MPRKPRKPAYTLHKPTGQARVRIDGKDHYLGSYGTPESRELYDDIVAEWQRKRDTNEFTLTIDELCLKFLEHAVGHALKCVRGLRAGRSEAREGEPVEPVADHVVDATIEFLPLIFADNEQAARLLAKASVQSEVMRLKKLRSMRVGVDTDFVLQSLVENVQKSLGNEPVPNEKGGLSYRYDGTVANKSLELIGRHLAMFVDRQESKHGPTDNLLSQLLARVEDERCVSRVGEFAGSCCLTFPVCNRYPLGLKLDVTLGFF